MIFMCMRDKHMLFTCSIPFFATLLHVVEDGGEKESVYA